MRWNTFFGACLSFLIGLDLGTTGFRYECYDVEGNVLSSGRAELRGQTVEEWVKAFLKAVPSNPPYERGGDVILSAQSTSGTIVLVDKFGKPVFEPLLYYEKAVEEFKELSRWISTKQLSDIGVSISSTSPLPKILRIKRRFPERFKDVRWILSPTTWLLYRLLIKEGEEWRDVETDWTNALKLGEDITGAKPRWFTPIFQDAGIDLDLLPRIVRCGKLIGEAQSQLSKKKGLKGARVYQGMTDGNASALAVGCLNNGDFGFSCGTTTAFKYVSPELKPHPAIYYHLHPVKGYLAGAAPVTAGMLEWFSKKIMGIETGEAFKLAEKASSRGELGLYFPQGDREPFNDPMLGASFLKLWPIEVSSPEARGMMFNAMVLGLTFFEKYYITLFEGLFNKPITEAKITGGGTRSRWWNRIRASIYGFEVKVMDERSGIGAVMPAAMEEHLYPNYKEASEKLLRVVESFKPEQELASKYRKEERLFLKRWHAIKNASDID